MSVGLGTPEVLHLLYKYYGGIDWFENKPVFLLGECLRTAIKKEGEIPKLINEILSLLLGQPNFEERTNMRTAEEIMKDYGLERR